MTKRKSASVELYPATKDVLVSLRDAWHLNSLDSVIQRLLSNSRAAAQTGGAQP